MLEDFIESNRLKARIIPYPAAGKLVKCRLFRAPGRYLLAVFFSKDRLSREKLCLALKADSVQPVSGPKVEEITGYNELFVPPISVYGVKVVLDKKIFEEEKVHCLVSEEKALEISPLEIAEANEGSLVEGITL
jgi:prolyl-tRNA editing enzyme YbaK/EbsC (Cys-tRNA(Pro) deacylase)